MIEFIMLILMFAITVFLLVYSWEEYKIMKMEEKEEDEKSIH